MITEELLQEGHGFIRCMTCDAILLKPAIAFIHLNE
jgi:hypothetical protein